MSPAKHDLQKWEAIVSKLTEPRPKLENNFITEFKPEAAVATYKMSLSSQGKRKFTRRWKIA